MKPTEYFSHEPGGRIVGQKHTGRTHPRPAAASPRWNTLTKLVVALTVVAVTAFLVVRLQFLIGPLLSAFILAYLLQPVAEWMTRRRVLSWRTSVTILYLVIVLILLGLLAAGGVGLIQQIQNLIRLVQDSLTQLPDLLNNLSHKVFAIGPFEIDFSKLDFDAISRQVLSFAQTALGRIGTLLGALASGAVGGLGWTAFVLLASYFVLTESGGLRERIITVEIPGYGEDILRLGEELGRIWNAFLRGQMIMFLLTAVVYTILLSLLGVHYAIGIALLAGLARFVPYVGPAVTWTVLVLVTYFQGFKLFDLTPFAYTLLVFGVAWAVDVFFDNYVNPRIMAQTLKVHPAGVMVAAIIAANLFGILGVMLAAPILATCQLLGQYIFRKMLDQDPWPEPKGDELPPAFGLRKRLLRWWKSISEKKSNRTIIIKK
jgi:predicted PurR-regulated permease PerM